MFTKFNVYKHSHISETGAQKMWKERLRPKCCGSLDSFGSRSFCQHFLKSVLAAGQCVQLRPACLTAEFSHHSLPVHAKTTQQSREQRCTRSQLPFAQVHAGVMLSWFQCCLTSDGFSAVLLRSTVLGIRVKPGSTIPIQPGFGCARFFCVIHSIAILFLRGLQRASDDAPSLWLCFQRSASGRQIAVGEAKKTGAQSTWVYRNPYSSMLKFHQP